ncbi:hypothetical protein C8R47DRAFT_709785 [Mycena vitilis]|nr:hypothetical protein C8R47DRAFT_709785 [Mycena vitilis]
MLDVAPHCLYRLLLVIRSSCPRCSFSALLPRTVRLAALPLGNLAVPVISRIACLSCFTKLPPSPPRPALLWPRPVTVPTLGDLAAPVFTRTLAVSFARRPSRYSGLRWRPRRVCLFSDLRFIAYERYIPPLHRRRPYPLALPILALPADCRVVGRDIRLLAILPFLSSLGQAAWYHLRLVAARPLSGDLAVHVITQMASNGALHIVRIVRPSSAAHYLPARLLPASSSVVPPGTLRRLFKCFLTDDCISITPNCISITKTVSLAPKLYPLSSPSVSLA